LLAHRFAQYSSSAPASAGIHGASSKGDATHAPRDSYVHEAGAVKPAL
jgi:hypothetical protein